MANIVAAMVRPARTLGCRVGTGDLMVETEAANYHPDVVVSCAPPMTNTSSTNPCFIVEAWHRSPTGWDRTDHVD